MLLGALAPMVCSYRRDGREFGITLYGTSEEQVLVDNADLPELRVDGVLVAEFAE
jgi:hypothetical protein